MNEKQKTKSWIQRIDWINSLFLTLTPILAIVLTWAHIRFEGMNWSLMIPFIILYFATGLSITGGYHRLISHKAYKANPIVKLLYLIFGAATFQNSALKWCSDHRVHHRHCDHEKDPYNIQKGFFWAHMGWIMMKAENEDSISHSSHAIAPTEDLSQYPKDLTSDKLIMWQHRHYLAISVLTGLGLPVLIGYFMGSPLGGLAILGFARIVFVHHMTFFINSLCHIVGSQPYTDTNSAKDSPIMALFSYGEGYHNFHHYFQSDYRNGIKWYHFDPTKWLISGLQSVGLASDLKRTSDEDILRAQLKMEHKRLQDKKLAKGQKQEEVDVVEDLASRIDQLLQQLIIAKRQWNNSKAQNDHNISQQVQEKIKNLQKDLSQLMDSWSQRTNSRLKFYGS